MCSCPALTSDDSAAPGGPAQGLKRVPGAGWRRRLGAVAVVLALGWYLVFVAGKTGVHAGGSDTSGYFNNAKLMREGRLHTDQRRLEGVETAELSPYAFVPLGFRPTGEGGMVPTYSLGLPALYAATAWLVPLETGAAVVTWLMVLGSLWVTYRLGRLLGFAPGWATFGAAVLAACPLFLFMSIQAMSDMPSLFWTTLALVLAWDSKRRPALAFWAGMVVAVAVFLRPANALVAGALLIPLGRDWRRWLLLGLGGLPGGLAWLATNHVLYDEYVTTGYGDVGGLFGWANVPRSLRSYLAWLPVLLPILPALVWAWPLNPAKRPVAGVAAMAATWALLCSGFYAFYFHTSEDWWYLRFLLPVFPSLIVLALAGVRGLVGTVGGLATAASPWWRTAVPVGLVLAVGAVTFGVQVGASRRLGACDSGLNERVYPQVCAWVREKLPANALLVCMQASGAITYYNEGQVFLRWEVIEKAQSRLVFAAAARAGRPVYAVLYPFELETVFRDHIVGRWSQIGAVYYVTIWRLDDPAGVMP